jgi:hypothetical protein
MKFKDAALAGFVVMALVGLLTDPAVALPKPVDKRATLASIASDCGSSIDANGFGHSKIDGEVHIENQQGLISTPCMLHLGRGAALHLENSSLQAANLFIDDGGVGSGSFVHFDHVTLNALGEAGFQIRLRQIGGKVQIDDSNISFSLSVGVSVGRTDSSSSLKVSNANISSLGSKTEGILLVTSGAAEFTKNVFRFTDPKNQAVLYGETCRQRGNQGAAKRCQG